MSYEDKDSLLYLADLRIDELESENAKLRKERNHWHVEQVHAYSNWEDAYRHASELEAENAKLRELLRDALKTLHHKRLDGSVGCIVNCPRWQFGKDCQLVDGCWLELEAAKLEVEV